MNLLLDVGNSRTKWATLADGTLCPAAPVTHSVDHGTASLAQAFSTLPRPQSILVSNVAGKAMANAITGLSADLWSLRPAFVEVEREKHGVKIAYRDCSQLGVDRWLALLAVRHDTSAPSCIADCGTAVTVDGMDGRGEHLGGWIIPGAAAMGEALLRSADGITAAAAEAQPGFGKTTAECISNGAATAIAALVDVAVERIAGLCGSTVSCTVTGGGAGAIVKLLKCEYRCDPDLVLRGLARLA